MLFPTVTGLLGCWQLHRLFEKKRYIEMVGLAINSDPIDIYSFEDLSQQLNSHKRLRLHGSPISIQQVALVGPRASPKELLVLKDPFANQVIAPFALESDGYQVIVNYGLVSFDQATVDSKDLCSQLTVVESPLIEKRSWGMDSNDPLKNKWLYADPAELQKHFDTDTPVIYKAVQILANKEIEESKRIVPHLLSLNHIPNRHLEYVITWWGMCLASILLSI